MSASFDRGIARAKAQEAALLSSGAKMYEVPNTQEARTLFTEVSSKYGRRLEFSEVPLSDFADVSPDLIKAKVTELILRGYSRASYWSQLVYMYEMQEQAETINLTNSRNFKVTTGFNTSRASMSRDSKRYKVSLEGVKDSAEKQMRLDFNDRDLLSEHTSDFERELVAAGTAFAQSIRDDIISAYLANKTTQQPLGGDSRYAAIMKLVSKLSKVSGGLNAVIIDSDDFTEAITEITGGVAQFANALVPVSNATQPFDRSENKYSGLVGYLGGRIAVYVADYTSASLNGNILGIAADEGLVLGLNKPFTIDGDFTSLRELYKTRLSMRYDLVPANKLAIGYVSGA